MTNLGFKKLGFGIYFGFWILLFGFMTQASVLDPKLDDIISKIRDNQGKITDMSADITTTIVSNLKEKKTMEQKGSIKTKGDKKSKMEMLSPISQITITNGDKMAVINPDSGQKYVQDLSKLRKQSGADLGQSSFDQTKILDKFDLSFEEKGVFQKSFVITGVPKEKNQFMGKMKFYVDTSRYVPVKIEIHNAQGKIISSSDIEYASVKGIWVASKNTSSISTPAGKMEVSMKFENIKINEGIPDKEFEIK